HRPGVGAPSAMGIAARGGGDCRFVVGYCALGRLNRRSRRLWCLRALGDSRLGWLGRGVGEGQGGCRRFVGAPAVLLDVQDELANPRRRLGVETRNTEGQIRRAGAEELQLVQPETLVYRPLMLLDVLDAADRLHRLLLPEDTRLNDDVVLAQRIAHDARRLVGKPREQREDEGARPE